MSSSVLEREEMVVVEETTDKGPFCQAPKEIHDCKVRAVAMGAPTCGPFPTELVCQTVVDLYQEGVRVGGLCGDCHRKVVDCWSIVPLL